MDLPALARALFATAVLTIASAPQASAQCAMCRTALEASEQGRRLAGKFNSGILFLLGAPFGVATAIGVAMRRSCRNVR